MSRMSEMADAYQDYCNAHPDEERETGPVLTYKLLAHDGPHGYGISLTSHDEAGDTAAGFVLQNFKTADERDKYARELADTFGFDLRSLNSEEQ